MNGVPLMLLANQAAAVSLPSRPDVLAQRMELQARWRSYNAPHDLKPGDLVVEKTGLGYLVSAARPTHVFMIWRLLDPFDQQDALLIDTRSRRFQLMFNRLDCLLAALSDCGTALEFRPHELAQLQRAE